MRRGSSAQAAALLLGAPTDAHLAALAEELPDVGLEARILDPRLFPARGTASLALRGATAPKLAASFVDPRDVRVGWYSSQHAPRIASHVDRRARPFALASARAALTSLRAALQVPWVNDPLRGALASDKFAQLLVARERGLRVPETLVTNDPDAIRSFVKRRGSLAVKSPSGSAGLADHMRVLTQRVRAKELPNDDAIRAAPVMAQEYVAKKSEVRATVIGGRVLAVEIFSQETASTRVDWRRYDHRTRYETLRLPRATEQACVAITRDVGLDYSGIDLIRTPRDEYVFLEVNSEPAWLWIEDLAGLKITRALAKLLAKRAGL